jgi:hypothetical protein
VQKYVPSDGKPGYRKTLSLTYVGSTEHISVELSVVSAMFHYETLRS